VLLERLQRGTHSRSADAKHAPKLVLWREASVRKLVPENCS
jgi:hypothetical protein